MKRHTATSLSVLALLPAFLGATLAYAQQSSAAPAVQRLLILSKNDRVLSIVDPATLKILARVPAGPDPHEVVAARLV